MQQHVSCNDEFVKFFFIILIKLFAMM